MKALPTRDAAEVLGVSQRTVQRRGIDTVADLPADAQIEWAGRPRYQRVVTITDAAPGQLALSLATPEGPNLSDEDRDQALKRYAVIEPILKPEEHRGVWLQCRNSKVAVVDFLARQHNTKPRTIYHWLKAWKDRGLPGLVNRDRADKGVPRALNGAALDFLLAAAMPKKGAYGEYSVAEIYRAYQEERAWRATHAGRKLGDFERAKYGRYIGEDGRLRPEAQLPAASYETFRAWFDRIPEVVRVMGREGVEQFSATQEIISFRAIAQVEPLEYVVMDHRRLDLFCLVRSKDGWKLVRPWLTAAIDMRTRKWLAWAIVETPSSDSIAAVLKRVFLDHGLPKACYWDNGKDFTCEWLEGKSTRNAQASRIGELGESWRGVLETLGVRVHHAIVKRARAKLIEPNFLNTSLYDRSLPWWCGHQPGARPDSFADLVDQHERWAKGEAEATPFVTIEQIALLYDEFLQSLNERPHSGEGMAKILPDGKRGWLCPNEAWELLIKRVPRRSVPADVLAFAFAKRKALTVRQGEVRMTFGGQPYHYRMTDNPIRLMALNGREVVIGYDPMDLGTVAVYCEDRLLGLAENVELRRMGEAAFVADERERRTARREVKRFISAVHREVYVPDFMERANRRAAIAPARMNVAREEISAPVPAAIAAAAEAKREEESFSFASAGAVDVVKVAEGAYRDEDPDDEFDFFRSGGN